MQGVDAPALCAVIRCRVESLLSDIAKARREREALACQDYSESEQTAFNEGAGAAVCGPDFAF